MCFGGSSEICAGISKLTFICIQLYCAIKTSDTQFPRIFIYPTYRQEKILKSYMVAYGP